MPDIDYVTQKFFDLYRAVLENEEWLGKLRSGDIVSFPMGESPLGPALVIEVVPREVFDRRLEVEKRMREEEVPR